MRIYKTADGGAIWVPESGSIYIGSSIPPGVAHAILAVGEGAQTSRAVTLPPGAIAADMLASGDGWVAVQDGSCQGDKLSEKGAICEQSWRLMATSDGGVNWIEIPGIP